MRLQIEAYHEAALVYAAVKLDLPDKMGERTWTVEQLAGALGTSAPHLFRFLRGLATLGICRELPDGTFALAPGGWSLRSDSHSRLNKKVQIVVEQYWRPWSDLVSCLKTGKPAFDHVFGMNVTDWRRENAAQGVMFATYLTDETFAHAGSILEVLECGAEAKKVADIGGGWGAMLTPLLIAFPHLTGVLFETPHMIDMAKPFLHVFDQFHLLDRIELVPGDFFEAVPVKADLYLLKNVLQQWTDAEALAILHNLRRAMPEGARLAIIERLMPERAADDPAAIMVDLHMMTITGGKTRSVAEFTALLREAGLTPAKTTSTTSGLAVIEAVRG